MLYNANTRRLFEVFLKLNPNGSVSEFAQCRKRLQQMVDFETVCGNQRALDAL